jgi:hypothetical protein
MSASNSVPSAPIGHESPFGPAPLEVYPRFGFGYRLLFVAIGSALIAMLIIASQLTPDPFKQGYGTHQKLGLPPCSAIQIFGVRCPACGMTTSWSHVMNGNVLRAFGTNAGGTLLALTSIVAGPWLVGTGLRGKYIFRPPPLEWIAIGSVVIGLVTLVEWGVRISR